MSVIIWLFCLENYEISQRTLTQYRWAMHAPHPWSLKWHTWKLHDERDIESMGCIFSLIPITWTMHIINTMPRSLDLCAGKSRSSKTLTHGCIIKIIHRSTLGELGKDNSHVPYYQFKRLLYFICHKQVYFGVCFHSNQAHRLCCGAYFQVRFLAYIDHTFVSIASLFAAIKNYIFKIKAIRVKSIFIKLNWGFLNVKPLFI